MIPDGVKDFAIEAVKETDQYNALAQWASELDKAQVAIAKLMEIGDDEALCKLKVGTVLALGVLTKVADGKNPKDFDNADWKAVADKVVDGAVLIEDGDYSAFVFDLFDKYISFSVECLRGLADPDKCDAIEAIVEELRVRETDFREGNLSEVDYIEGNLWLCLEAIIKLMATLALRNAIPEVAHFVEGMATYAFEYGRLVVYSKEQARVTRYLEEQELLDIKLETQYQEHLAEVEAQAAEFNRLIACAFDADFRTALKGSVELARAAGVDEAELLKNVDDVDEFFM